jgi:diguanylate cyclase (GGDEF)-like protein
LPGPLLDTAGLILLGVGIVALIGQIEGVGWTLPSGWGLASLDGMVALKLYGLAFVLCATRHRRCMRTVAAILLTLAAANVLSNTTDLQFTLRSLLAAPDDPIPLLTMPMAPAAALAVLIASALLWPLSAPATRARRIVLGSGYTVVLVIGCIPLFGYLLGLQPAADWPGFTGIAALTAFGLAVVGGAGVAAAAYAQRALEPDRSANWGPVLVGLASVLVSSALYQALEAQQARSLQQLVRADAESIRREVHAQVGHQLWILDQIVNRLERNDELDLATWWERDAIAYLEDGRYSALAWLAPDFEIRRLVTSTRTDYSSSARDIRSAIASLDGAVSDRDQAPTLMAGQGNRYHLVRAVQMPDDVGGVLVVVADMRVSLTGVLRPFAQRGYLIRVMNGRRSVLQVPQLQPAAAPAYTEVLGDVGPGWRITVTPTPELVQRLENPLPETVLTVGVILGLFAAALLWTLQLLRRSHAELYDLNRSLESKVDQRTAELVQAVREREQATADFAHAASHDSLTGLANRTLFSELLDHALADVQREGGLLAVMFLDLDNFKDVNDRLGHQMGDELLKQVCDRILGVLRHADVLARQGGDEFLILANHLPSADAAAAVAAKILDELRTPFQLEGFEAHVMASIGIALYAVGRDSGEAADRGESLDASTLVKQADAAMYQAKESGRNRYEFYSPRLQARVLARVELRNALNRALARGEIEVYYQPRVALDSGRVTGAEALAHWRDPERGLVSTELFVSVAEETGLITELDQMVLRRACADLGIWERAGDPLPVISVNFSARHLRDRRLLDTLRDQLQETPHYSDYLEMELTERVLVNESDHQEVLREIRRLGIRVAVDDFGTGNSSFAYFRRFPIDIVKIDRSFISELERDPDAAMITQTIIGLARNLRLRVIAEGVETIGQRDRLRTQGCHEGQGFLFGQPMPAELFLAHWRLHGA